jgi:methyltransferase (TIGR00027 family)
VDSSPAEPTGEVISLTAIAAASGRAVESSRLGALVDDPYAAALVSAAGSAIGFPTVWPESFEHVSPAWRRLLLSSAYVGLRTRFVDDYLAGAAGTPDGEPTPEVDLPRQVVIVGAGLDTRAFRLTWPGRTEIYELDDPEVLLFKRDIVRGVGGGPKCEWFAVPTDLSHSWVDSLIAAGFDRRRRSSWVVEGTLSHLSTDAQLDIITNLARLSVPGSRAFIGCAIDIASSPEADENMRLFAEEMGMPTEGVLARANPPDPAEILRDHEWVVVEHTVEELAERYGRSLELSSVPGVTEGDDPDGARPDQNPVGGFITAELH